MIFKILNTVKKIKHSHVKRHASITLKWCYLHCGGAGGDELLDPRDLLVEAADGGTDHFAAGKWRAHTEPLDEPRTHLPEGK